MNYFKIFIRFLLLDYFAYPKVDLLCKDVLERQYINIRKFKIIRLRLYAVIFMFLLSFIFFEILSKFFNVDIDSSFWVFVHFLVLLCIFIPFLFFLNNYKCPNCGNYPKGRSIDFGQGVIVSKGLHPFPKRCENCGFYLSKRSLIRDLKNQTKESNGSM